MSRKNYSERCWAPPAPAFNTYRKGSNAKKPVRLDMPGAAVDRPPLFVPDCEPTEQRAALEALAKMHAARPLRPPGR